MNKDNELENFIKDVISKNSKLEAPLHYQSYKKLNFFQLKN